MIELLVVIGLIATLAGLAAPAVVSLQNSLAINGGAEELVAALGNARQDAVARSAPVEFRVYRIRRSGDAAETWSSWGTYFVRTTGTSERLEPRGKRTTLPPAIVVSDLAGAAVHSTILTESADGVPRAGRERIGDVDVDYRAFRFFPDGSTDLPSKVNGSAALWFVTLLRENDAAKAAPSNFVTVRVDRMNGSVARFQP